MNVCSCVYPVPLEVLKRVGSIGTGVTEGCEPSVDAGNQISKTTALRITAEPSPQALEYMYQPRMESLVILDYVLRLAWAT